MQESIYSDIGGRDAVESVVSEFYDRVLADERLAHYFEDQDMTELRAHQVQFVSAVAGGPVEYDGADMRAAHEGMGLGDAEFDAVAEHLDAALRANDVGSENREAILSKVEALRDPVLGR